MILKLKKYPDLGCYGRVGEKVFINKEEYFVGDVYKAKIMDYEDESIVNTVIVHKEAEDKVFFMGIGELREGESIQDKVKSYSELKVGDILDNLIVCQDE